MYSSLNCNMKQPWIFPEDGASRYSKISPDIVKGYSCKG